jgi:hypothetical protein
MKVKAILYPTEGFHLDKGQFHALTMALADVGESRFYMSITESPSGPFLDLPGTNSAENWILEEPTFEEYKDLDPCLENAIYSAKGDWGILLSHELHGLFVSSTTVWSGFANYYPKWKQDLQAFTALWNRYHIERNVDIAWLYPLLRHVNERAAC